MTTTVLEDYYIIIYKLEGIQGSRTLSTMALSITKL